MINNAGCPVATFGLSDSRSVIEPATGLTPPVARRTVIASAALLCLGLATPAEALVIDVTYDSSVTSLGNTGSVTTAEIENAYGSVAAAFEAAIANNVTVSIGVGWGEYGGQTVAAGNIGESSYNTDSGKSYSQISALLSAAAPGDALPASNPTASLIGFLIPDAEALALGLSAAPVTGSDGCACDGYIGFDSSVTFTFNDQSGVAANTYDFVAAAEHETEEVLGRASGLTSTSPLYATPLDIFRYSAPNTNSDGYNATAYASTNGGVTDLGTFNSSGTGDRGDWATPGGTTDAQNAAAPTGVKAGLSISDEDVLTGLGWHMTGQAGNLFSGTNAPAGATASVNNPTNTPEPASLSLFLAGVGAVGWLRRRRPS